MIAKKLCASALMLQQGGANSNFTWDLVTMWHYMGIPAKSVVILLLVICASSVWIMIDHALTFSSARKQSQKL
jgi:hypothetical protein